MHGLGAMTPTQNSYPEAASVPQQRGVLWMLVRMVEVTYLKRRRTDFDKRHSGFNREHLLAVEIHAMVTRDGMRQAKSARGVKDFGFTTRGGLSVTSSEILDSLGSLGF